MSTTPHVIALFSPSGGAGRTSFALALSVAAEKAGLTAAIVDASSDGDATRYAEHFAIKATVFDVSGDDHGNQECLNAVTRLREEVDVVIVDTPVGLRQESLLVALAADGASMLALSGMHIAELTGLLTRVRLLSEAGTPRDRLGYILNKVVHNVGHERSIEAVRDAMFEQAQCHGTIWSERKHVEALAPVTAADIIRRVTREKPPRRPGRTAA